MPRTTNPAGKILEFFRTQPLTTADLVYSLVRDEMTSRRKAEAPKPRARRKASKPPGVGATPPASEALPLGTPAKRVRRTKAQIAAAAQRISAVDAAVTPPRPPRPPGLVSTVGEEA